MVYSVLTIAVASGHPIDGALTMFAFGLGMPNLLAMGLAAERVRPLLRNVRLRRLAGAVIHESWRDRVGTRSTAHA